MGKLEELNAKKEALEKQYEEEATKANSIQKDIEFLENLIALKKELGISFKKLDEIKSNYQNVVNEIAEAQSNSVETKEAL